MPSGDGAGQSPAPFLRRRGKNPPDPLFLVPRFGPSLPEGLSRAVEIPAVLGVHGGRFCLINRADRTAEIFAAMRACLIEPKVLLPVISKPGRGVSLVLVEGKKGARPGLVFEEPLFLYGADGSVSETVRQIYGNGRENVVL